jgi:hypothetical protein
MAGQEDDRHERAEDPGHHSSAAGAPGASGPGEAAYDGAATIGDEGAAAGPEAFVDPNGTPPDVVDAAAAALHKKVVADEGEGRSD